MNGFDKIGNRILLMQQMALKWNILKCLMKKNILDFNIETIEFGNLKSKQHRGTINYVQIKTRKLSFDICRLWHVRHNCYSNFHLNDSNNLIHWFWFGRYFRIRWIRIIWRESSSSMKIKCKYDYLSFDFWFQIS